MSRFFKKFIAILLLLSILSSNVTAMALEDDSGNSYSSASTIPMDASISGVINYSGDVDYFKFIAPATGTYYITSTGSMDLYGVTYNSTYSKIISNDDIGEGNNNFEMSATLTAGKTYFVKVRHYNKSQTGSYMVRITAPNSKDITAVVLPYQTAPLYANTGSERCKVQLFNKNIGVERKYYVEAYTSSDNKTWTLSGASDFVFVAGSNTATLSIPVNISEHGNIYTKAVVYFEKKGGEKLKEVIKADIDRVAPQMLPTNNSYTYGESAGLLIDNLNALGLDTGNGTLFASKTLAAVVAVQINNNNLAIDAKAGENTCAEINNLILSNYFDQTGKKLSSIKTVLYGNQKKILDSQNDTIKNGSEVKGVKHLQAILKGYLNLNIGDIDGNYGEKTTAAVKAVQKYSGITVTGTVEKGITGNTTWAKIYSLINSNESTKIALDQLYNEYRNPAQSVYITAKNKLAVGDYDTIYARSTNATSMKLLITGPEYYKSITSEGSTISYKFEPSQSGTYYITVTANEGGALPQTEKVCVEVGKKETGNSGTISTVIIGDYAVAPIKTINGIPYGNMKQVLDYLFDIIGTLPNDSDYFITTWNYEITPGKAGVHHYTVHVLDPDSHKYITKIYYPNDSVLSDADSGNPCCDILKIAEDLGFSNKIYTTNMGDNSKIVYIDADQSYLNAINKISEFISENQSNIDGIIVTLELLPPSAPVGTVLQFMKLQLQGYSKIASIAKLASSTGKTIGEVSKEIDAAIITVKPLVKTVAEAIELQGLLKTANSVDDAIAAIGRYSIKEFDAVSLTNTLKTLDNAAWTSVERATLKTEVIRKSGFNNFDWRGTLDDIKGFTNMHVEVVELKTPITLYRRGYPNEPSSASGLGRWWGDQSRTIEQVRNELAVLDSWGNPLTVEYKVVIPKGTKVLKGTAAPQVFRNTAGEIIESRPGGGVQYFLNNVDNAWIVN